MDNFKNSSMIDQTFECIDAHTCGNPVRLVVSGGPDLQGKSMAEKRLHFLEEYDWIRKGLMFEPRGHDMMSGSILYPPSNDKNDAGVLFIETSGCLPMCGHGTIGTITIAIENGLIEPKTSGEVKLETPAGLVNVGYELENKKVSSVRIQNVPSYLALEDITYKHKFFGNISIDISYGGNFYAIIDSQENFDGFDNYSVEKVIEWSREIRNHLRETVEVVHPLDSRINGLSHVMWAGTPLDVNSTARNAVFYGDKAIDRSPCGTGTSARMAQWFAKGKLSLGDEFIHESIIGSKFKGKVLSETSIGSTKGIIPQIEGWAKVFGHNNITINEKDDPYAFGFQVV